MLASLEFTYCHHLIKLPKHPWDSPLDSSLALTPCWPLSGRRSEDISVTDVMNYLSDPNSKKSEGRDFLRIFSCPCHMCHSCYLEILTCVLKLVGELFCYVCLQGQIVETKTNELISICEHLYFLHNQKFLRTIT